MTNRRPPPDHDDPALPAHPPNRWWVAILLMALAPACSTRSDHAGEHLTFGGKGLADGKFSYPRAIAISDALQVFVVDKTGRVQRFSPDGRFELGWKMPQYAQGKPVGLSVHPDGRLFVADTHYHRVSVFDPDGNPLASFGHKGTGPGQFLLPTDVAFDREGNIYVGEYQGNDRITRWAPDLTYIDAIATDPIEGARLSRPSGILVDDEQTLWVADACNHRLIRLTLDGDLLAVFGSFGDDPGQLRYPYDITLTGDNEILVCEYEGNRLQWFDKQGNSLRTWGSRGRGPGQLFAPWGVASAKDGTVYVVDSLNDRIQIVKP